MRFRSHERLILPPSDLVRELCWASMIGPLFPRPNPMRDPESAPSRDWISRMDGTAEVTVISLNSRFLPTVFYATWFDRSWERCWQSDVVRWIVPRWRARSAKVIGRWLALPRPRTG